MNLKWGLYAQCINEEKLVQAKLDWAIRLGFDDIVIVEGHHPHYKKHKDHLSVDKTTEILKSYEDQITYIPLGEVSHQAVLRDTGYKNLKQDLDVVIMCDMDEFYLEDDLDFLDRLYKRKKNLKLTLTNSLIFLDKDYCAEHIRRIESPPIQFSKDTIMHLGQFHERIFRYNKYYNYNRSPFIINDIYGRFPMTDSSYFGERELYDDLFCLHYKNFKMDEAKERHQMYKERGDQTDYDKEWELLEKVKEKYPGEHPREILGLL